MVKHENLYIQNFHVYIVKEIKGAGTYLDDIHSFQCTFIKLERVSLPPMTMGRPIMIKITMILFLYIHGMCTT